jgi:lipoprotein-releasing system ATP-binding protein
MAEPILVLDGVARSFTQGDARLDVLRGASARLHPGEIVALTWPSGAGKSTLLHIAGLLEKPDGGEVLIAGRACGRLSERERTRLRRTELGFVYQFHYLLPEFSALENVVIPQMIAGRPKTQAGERARHLLDLLGVGARAAHRPAQLSGGEQQRVAIARAMANRPKLLIADEPTGNLDPRTAEAVFDALIARVRGEGMAALIATHSRDLAARMDRVLELREGRVVEIRGRTATPHAASAAEGRLPR